MWPNSQESVDSVTFTEEILNGKLRFFCTEGTVLVRKIQPYTNQKCLRGWHKKLTTGKQMHEVPENYWIILTLLLLTLNIKEMLAICGCIYFLWAKEQKTWASPSVHLYIGFKKRSLALVCYRLIFGLVIIHTQ